MATMFLELCFKIGDRMTVNVDHVMAIRVGDMPDTTCLLLTDGTKITLPAKYKSVLQAFDNGFRVDDTLIMREGIQV